MKRIVGTLLGILTVFFSLFYSSCALAAPNCSKGDLAKNPHDVLACYIALPEEAKPLWVIDVDEHDKRGLSIETYNLVSQEWPKPTSGHSSVWKHRLIIYRPDQIKSHQALLFVNGGTSVRYNKDDPGPVKIDFARIALATHTVVVDLQDVPKQYLTLGKNLTLKEDELVAYSWKEFLDNPAQNAYWPLQLPMAKAVIKAMDATQEIIQNEDDFKITHFVLSGVSKRGWAACLAALSDNRVNAVVPILINVMNMKQGPNKPADKPLPAASQPYVAEHIPEKIHSKEFEALLNIIDPLTYLHSYEYKARFNIPKYFITASGDDFFIPDSLNLYLHNLPGENSIRVLPNQGHAVSNKMIEDALLAYYETIIFQIPRPQIRAKMDASGRLEKVSANEVPTSVTLWEAQNNKSRDFRSNSNVSYTSKKLSPTCVARHCDYVPEESAPKNGWKAYFVEAAYDFTNGDHLILTTPAYVIGSKPSALPIKKTNEAAAMTDQNKYLSQLVDVVALSKKACKRPIEAHLAYATENNFVGQRIDGYTPGLTDMALMTKTAAEALVKVQNDLLKEHGYGLLIYDSYRPKQAVQHFVRWSKLPPMNQHELDRKKLQYPDIEKNTMFERGYVAEDSQHCYGHTVDLVLVDKNGKELNHGVPFDYMGTKSHDTATAKDIGEEAFNNRKILMTAMKKQGFVPYPLEYWHFSYEDKTIHEAMDIKITPALKGLNVDKNVD
jgi:PhoPQ-activated pathogenicity-related protein/D-alanyl-D-alanine dipeptidase